MFYLFVKMPLVRRRNIGWRMHNTSQLYDRRVIETNEERRQRIEKN